MDHSCSSTKIYEWSHLSYEGESPLHDIYDIDHEDDRCDWSGSEKLEFQGPPLPIRAASKTHALSGVLIEELDLLMK